MNARRVIPAMLLWGFFAFSNIGYACYTPPTIDYVEGTLVSPHEGGVDVTFVCAVKDIGCGDIANIQWDIDKERGTFDPDPTYDGAYEITHTYETPGLYVVAVRVTNTCGEHATELCAIHAQDAIFVNQAMVWNGYGDSWENAYADLQDALDMAVDGHQIWVAEGTYTPTDGTNRSVSFELVSGVKLYGGFAGTETALAERDWEGNETVLSGNIDSGGNEDSYHVVTGADNATLDGFTITNGNADNDQVDYDYVGGGMYNYDCAPTVSNCSFNENTAIWGGGMGNLLGNPTVTSCVFNNNSASSSTYFTYGGGMYNDISAASVGNCSFTENTGDYGAAIYCNGQSDAAVENCTVTQNSAASMGGGIVANSSSYPQISNSIIWDNDDSYGDSDIDAYNSSVITVTYSDYGTTWVDAGSTINVQYCISVEPQFADPGNDDFHLKSSVGRWNGSSWVTDSVTSPCVDTGNPSSSYQNEPTPNGDRINMGSYGNTDEASKSNKEIYVSTSGSDTTGNGTIGNPYRTIKKGIDMVAAGGEVIITGGAGAYEERFSFDSSHKGFTMRGTGGAVIDGKDGGRVFRFLGASNITVDNVEIRNGKATNGGGMCIISSSSIVVKNCEFWSNEAYSNSGAAKGGALYISSCSPDIDNCDFDNNQASGAFGESYGGAIYTNDSGATFDYCKIGTNAALNNFSSDEIYTYGNTRPSYTNCKIRGWRQDWPFVDGDYMDYNVAGPYGSGNSDF